MKTQPRSLRVTALGSESIYDSIQLYHGFVLDADGRSISSLPVFRRQPKTPAPSGKAFLAWIASRARRNRPGR